MKRREKESALQVRYVRLQSELAPWTPIWGSSVIESEAAWKRMEAAIPEAWFDYALDTPDDAWFDLAHGTAEAAPPDLNARIHRLRELCRFQRTGGVPSQTVRAKHLTPKKQHEINQILAFLEPQSLFQKSEPAPREILDLGGGVGHLARHLAQTLACEITTLDRDPEAIETGRRLSSAPEWQLVSGRQQFVCSDFPSALAAVRPARFNLSLGLHTCGPLAWRHLESCTAEQALLNFGCCYDRLDPQTDVEHSHTAKGAPLAWTRQALFLATRAGTERTVADFQFQQRVLQYRYGLDLWLRSQGFAKQAESVGNTPPAAYSQSFAHYARNRFGFLQLPVPISDAELDAFFEAHRVRVERQRFAAFLQNVLARPLEVLLLLDRALWLDERVAHLSSAEPKPRAQVLEFFDPLLSPRNLGIVWNLEAPSARPST